MSSLDALLSLTSVQSSTSIPVRTTDVSSSIAPSATLSLNTPNQAQGVIDPLQPPPPPPPPPPFLPIPTSEPGVVHFTSPSIPVQTSHAGSSSSSSSSSSAVSTSSTSASTSSSSSLSSSSSSSQPTPASSFTPDPAPGGPQATVTNFTTGGVSTSSGIAAPAETGAAALTTPKSFFDNKPLSISVITVASLLALIFFILIGTWAVRKRRRNDLQNLAAELSSDNLVRSGFGDSNSSFGHGLSTDVEKGGYGADVIDKMEAVGGSRGDGAGGRYGAGPQRNTTQRSMTSFNSYAQHPYAAAQDPYAQRAFGQVSQPYAQPGPVLVQNAAYRPAIVAAPGQPYPQVMTYAGPYPQTQAAPTTQNRLSPTANSPSRNRESYQSTNLPNPFEHACPETVVTAAAAYDLAHGAPAPSQQFSIPRNIQRKPPPPFLTVNTNIMSPPAMSMGTMSMSPPARAAVDASRQAEVISESPQQRTSLLNTPHSPTSQGLGRKASDGRGQSARTMTSVSTAMLDYGRPPVAPPLPDEFGTSGSPLPDSPKVLKVVNI